MTKKISKFPDKKMKASKKKLIDKLRLKYPRGEQSLIGPDINYEEEFKTIKLSSNIAEHGYVKYGQIDFDRIFGFYLVHVIYRCLKTIYGPPDILKYRVLKKDTSRKDSAHITGWPLEWGYLIKSEDGSLFEILKEERSYHPDFIVWLHLENKPEKPPESMVRNFFEFLSLFIQLVEIIDNDYSFEKEMEKADRILPNGAPRWIINTYYQNYQAGKDLLELSEEWVYEIDESLRDLRNQDKWIESSNLHRKGNILYVSSIIYFLMAMEGFINLLYYFLLKPQFRKKEEYERAIWKHHDLEMRILHLPVYCDGFSKADFGPDDASYKEWLELRTFRNNLLHANITKENEFTVTVEDYFLFQYNPLFHEKKGKRKKNKKIQTPQFYIRWKEVIKVQESVQKFVSGIIEQMDETEKDWVKSWIDRLEIQFQGDKEEIFGKPIEILRENKKGS